MSDEPICKLCGHSHIWHRYPYVCAKCPAGSCSDGTEGRRYRESLRRSASPDQAAGPPHSVE